MMEKKNYSLIQENFCFAQWQVKFWVSRKTRVTQPLRRLIHLKGVI